MNAAIIDDRQEDRTHLQGLLARYAEEHHLDIQVDSFASGTEFLASHAGSYHLIFMDIFLGESDGIHVAEAYRSMDMSGFLIFLTTSEDHRAEAFTLHAFDYLIKPIGYKKFARVMDDFRRIVTGHHEPSLSIRTTDGTYQILYRDIRCARSEGNYIVLSSDTEYRYRETFHHLETQLAEDRRFLTVNCGILVNLDYVVQMDVAELTCLMRDGTRLPINRRQAPALRAAFIDHSFYRRTELLTIGGQALKDTPDKSGNI